MQNDQNGNFRDFEIPEDIINALLSRKLVIFAGSGISTESPIVYGYSFYDEIAEILGYKKKPDIPFCELMEEYVNKKGSRIPLIQSIYNRINYVKQFQAMNNLTVSFHDELSKIHFIEDIITTNWDDFFEIECGAIPIVTKEDFCLRDFPKRKVYKIHGSINNIGTIIATKSDYDKSYKNFKNSIIGSNLRLLLSTKTVVFVGYSLSDFDFSLLYKHINKELSDYLPQSYMVTIDESYNSKKLEFKPPKPIFTNGTYFMKKLFQHLCQKGILISNEIVESVLSLYELIIQLHEKIFDFFIDHKNPNFIFTLSYQDGIIDALYRMFKTINTGEYHLKQNIENIINKYTIFQSEDIKNGMFTKYAYFKGYSHIFELLKLENEEQIKNNFNPLFLIGYTKNIKSLDDFIDKAQNI